MTALIHDTRDRIAFAAEGVALGAGELLDRARERAVLTAALLLALSAAAWLALAGGGSTGGESTSASSATPPAPEVTFVQERGFSLSMPATWKRTDAPDGAVLAAVSADGSARATLWVERNPRLGFARFVSDSLEGLASLGTDARVVDRIDGPSLETSAAELRATIPLDGAAPGPYRVNLRAAGPYRYYLATQIAPGASSSVLGEAELLGSSLRPEVELGPGE